MASSSSISWMAAEKVSWYSTLILMVLLILNCCEPEEPPLNETSVRRSWLMNDRPCDEIYVVREGETLQTISEKCNDPFILEENPHILDFDDVYPGLVIKITSFGGN